MSYDQAQIVLDMLRAGASLPLHIINQVLELTGDLDHIACSMADAPEAA